MQVFTSSSKRTSLLELYSSEGCSSCPPAEIWMKSLRKHPELFRKFVPIEFHVDYWDYIGWKDPLADPSFTRRQRKYANEWSVSSVYTPGFALDGKEFRRWHAAEPFLQSDSKESETVGILRASRIDASTFKVTFASQIQLPETKNELEIYGALLGNGIKSNVTRGENRGRALLHEFVVVGFTRSRTTSTESSNVFTAILNLGQPIFPASSYSVAFWVSVTGSNMPLQALGGDLRML